MAIKPEVTRIACTFPFTRHGFDPAQLNLVGACSHYRTLAGAVNA